MSDIIFFDGFNSYHSASWPLYRHYSSWNYWYDDGVQEAQPSPRMTGDRYKLGANFHLRFPNDIDFGGEFIIGAACRFQTAAPFSSRFLESGRHESSWPMFSLGITYAGRFNLRYGSWYSGPGEPPFYACVSAPNSVPLGQWGYFEFHQKMATTTSSNDGFARVYINEELVCSIENIQNSWTSGLGGLRNKIHTVAFVGGAEGIDDVYVKYGTNLTILGDCRVDSLHPTSDYSVQFSRETGASNAGNINDLDYYYKTYTDGVMSETYDHQDIYTMSSLPFEPSTIHAVAPSAFMMSAEGSIGHLKFLYRGANRSDPTVVTATEQVTVPISIQRRYSLHEINPATGQPWTPNEVNEMEAGFRFVEKA